jgi:Ca2+-transporting ATPase
MSDLQSSRVAYPGLTDQEARTRLLRDGPNALPEEETRGFGRVVVDVLREPMLLLLAGIAVLYVLLGDRIEAVTISFAVTLVVALTIVQERRSERALEALRDLAAPKANVVREGAVRVVDQVEVVEGDLVVIGEGDRIPADAVVIDGIDLSLDESILTGESAPVEKRPNSGQTEMRAPGGEASPFVYSGTLVVRGHGHAVVKRTGPRTEIGRIGASLRDVGVRSSPLQRESHRLVRIMGVLGGILCVLAAAIYGFRGRWGEGVLVGLTMAISIVPEEIPVVLTIFMALGAWRIAKSHVLTRRLPAIETLGAATVLCVDKTGTLTQNTMAVAQVWVDGVTYDVGENPEALPASARRLIRYAMLASQPAPVDPMEKAFRRLYRQIEGEPPQEIEAMVAEYGLTPDLLAVSFLWRQTGRDRPLIATKGAPEAVEELCELDAERSREMRQTTQALADRGLRVLAVAAGEWDGDELPQRHHQITPTFLGLVALADPIRATVPAAIRECHQAGLRVMMLTGDHPATATSIARQIGLGESDILTGNEIEALDDAALREQVRRGGVYARIMPEQKLRLVRALQANGEVVAMTGDGVNDAPALRAADIGIAMGGRGTDVAREAADLVLLRDDFDSIVRAIRLGRRIFDNLRHAIAYIVAVHVPIAGLTIVPVLLGWPLVLLPLHIVLLEMTVDPACALVFEAQSERSDVMKRPPRPRSARLIERRDLRRSLAEGLAVFAATFGVFTFVQSQGGSANYARTLAFGTLIVANLSMIVLSTAGSRRAWDVLRAPSAALATVVGLTIAGMLFLILVPVVRDHAHFAPISFPDAVFACVCGLAGVFWLEGLKLLADRFASPRSTKT